MKRNEIGIKWNNFVKLKKTILYIPSISNMVLSSSAWSSVSANRDSNFLLKLEFVSDCLAMDLQILDKKDSDCWAFFSFKIYEKK